MQKTFPYFQPEYVSKFKCNGQACRASCCKTWAIDIDKKTYKKYSHIRPKSAAEEITKHLVENPERDCYTVVLDSQRRCPMLTEDNFCKIQRQYGEEYLSITCVSYPRKTYVMKDFFERSLSLTCPVVAALALLPEEPMAFEYVEVPKRKHDDIGRITIQNPPLLMVESIQPEHITIYQQTTISILQERSMTIDQRLIVLGFYFDKFDELIKTKELDNLADVSAYYMSDEFLQGDALKLAQKIEIDEHERMKIMMKIFEAIYGGYEDRLKAQNIYDANILKFVVDVLEIQPDENKQVSLTELVENWNKWKRLRKQFQKYFSTLFENYLVNEFFFNLYPFTFNTSIAQNFGTFVASYKMCELICISRAIYNFKRDTTKQPLNKIECSATMMHFANNVDHNKYYFTAISDSLKNKTEIAEIMKDLLDGKVAAE